jgi:histidine triad (HIT) family protein
VGFKDCPASSKLYPTTAVDSWGIMKIRLFANATDRFDRLIGLFGLADKRQWWEHHLMSCIFCDIAAGKAPSLMLWQDQRVLIFLSLEGHPLVIPRKHFASLVDLDDETGAAVMRAAKEIAGALRAATTCEGINLVLSDGAVAGQDVFHLHLHVKPRWKNDGVILSWDTTTAPNAERSRIAEALSAQMDAFLLEGKDSHE